MYESVRKGDMGVWGNAGECMKMQGNVLECREWHKTVGECRRLGGKVLECSEWLKGDKKSQFLWKINLGECMVSVWNV